MIVAHKLRQFQLPCGVNGNLAAMPPAIASAVFLCRTAGGQTMVWCLTNLFHVAGQLIV
jgi:hypothetical protein